jgi:hypothetical protein
MSSTTSDHDHGLSHSAHKLWIGYESWAIAEYGLRASEDRRSAARELKDSVDYRAKALPFHLNLLSDICQSGLDFHKSDPHHADSRRLLRQVAIQAQYLFDDLIFNVISLFDYIGCFAGLVAKGLNSHQIDWRKAVGTLKTSPHFRTAAAASKSAHSQLVERLLRYRSELTHFRRDRVDGYVSVDLMGHGGDDLQVSVPRDFARAVLRLDAADSHRNGEYPIAVVATQLVAQANSAAVVIVDALEKDVENLPNTTPATRPDMLVRRWSRAHVFQELCADPKLLLAGADHVGGMHAGTSFRLILEMKDGTSQTTEWIDLRPFLAETPDVSTVVSILRDAALRALRSS